MVRKEAHHWKGRWVCQSLLSHIPLFICYLSFLPYIGYVTIVMVSFADFSCEITLAKPNFIRMIILSSNLHYWAG